MANITSGSKIFNSPSEADLTLGGSNYNDKTPGFGIEPSPAFNISTYQEMEA